MTPEERRAFLSEGTRTGKLAVTDAHGAPHVVPVWFVLDGDDVLFNCGASSLKAWAIARDPAAPLVVDEEVPPYVPVAEGRSRSATTSRRCSPGRRGSVVATWATIGRRSSGAATPWRASC